MLLLSCNVSSKQKALSFFMFTFHGKLNFQSSKCFNNKEIAVQNMYVWIIQGVLYDEKCYPSV